MHQHQQTLRDLEAMREPSPFAIVGYAALFVSAIACVSLFVFSI